MEDAEEEVMGSAALCDIAILQSLSRQIHFGKFVAESKFQSDRKRFEALIRRGDVKAIERAITDEGVEKKVLERLALKAMVYGRDPASGRGRIDVDGVVGLFQVCFSFLFSPLHTRFCIPFFPFLSQSCETGA